MKILEKLKFEFVFAVLVLIILSIALFRFKNSEEVTTTIITALVGSLSAVTAFFFTKHNPRKDE